jgi:hypothetical protein
MDKHTHHRFPTHLSRARHRLRLVVVRVLDEGNKWPINQTWSLLAASVAMLVSPLVSPGPRLSAVLAALAILILTITWWARRPQPPQCTAPAASPHVDPGEDRSTTTVTLPSSSADSAGNTDDPASSETLVVIRAARYGSWLLQTVLVMRSRLPLRTTAPDPALSVTSVTHPALPVPGPRPLSAVTEAAEADTESLSGPEQLSTGIALPPTSVEDTEQP